MQIVLIGCGGIGSWYSRFLSAALRSIENRPSVLLCDGDRVEGRNLSYSCFEEGDVGKFKAEVLARRYGFDYFPFDVDEWNLGQVRDWLVVAATDELAVRRMVHERCTKWLDVRAVDENWVLFTHAAPRQLVEMYTSSDDPLRRGSCQTDYSRIRMGNVMAAAKACDITMKMLRGEGHEAYVISFGGQIDSPAPAGQRGRAVCSYCRGGGSIFYCRGCQIILCTRCLSECSVGCRFYNPMDFVNFTPIIYNNKIVIELPHAGPVELNTRDWPWRVNRRGNALTVSKIYQPMIVRDGQVYILKQVNLTQKWILRGVNATLVDITAHPYGGRVEGWHPNVGLGGNVCTDGRHISSCPMRDLREAIEHNFNIVQAVLNAADDRRGFHRFRDVINRWVERVHPIGGRDVFSEIRAALLRG